MIKMLLKKKKYKQRKRNIKFLHRRKKYKLTDKREIVIFCCCDNFIFQEMFKDSNLFAVARLQIVGNDDDIIECYR